MSSVIYVVPWAICDTESIYVKKVKGDDVQVPEKGSEFNSWCIRNVIASPDRRTKDTYAIVDVFNGYKEKMNEKACLCSHLPITGCIGKSGLPESR